MKTLVQLFVIAMLLSISSLVFADYNADFKKAYELSVKGEYEEVLPIYNELLKQNPNDPDLLYNAGSTYLMGGNLGKAVLYFERAIKNNPDCDDCRINLDRALESQKDRVINKQTNEQEESAGFDKMMKSFPLDSLGLTFIVFHVLFVLAFIVRRISNNERFRFALLLVLFIFLFLDLGFGSLLAIKNYNYEVDDYAVVMQKELSVKKGPNMNYEESFVVHEGLKVRLGEKVEDWYQVWLSNNLNGYVPAKAIEEI